MDLDLFTSIIPNSDSYIPDEELDVEENEAELLIFKNPVGGTNPENLPAGVTDQMKEAATHWVLAARYSAPRGRFRWVKLEGLNDKTVLKGNYAHDYTAPEGVECQLKDCKPISKTPERMPDLQRVRVSPHMLYRACVENPRSNTPYGLFNQCQLWALDSVRTLETMLKNKK